MSETLKESLVEFFPGGVAPAQWEKVTEEELHALWSWARNWDRYPTLLKAAQKRNSRLLLNVLSASMAFPSRLTLASLIKDVEHHRPQMLEGLWSFLLTMDRLSSASLSQLQPVAAQQSPQSEAEEDPGKSP